MIIKWVAEVILSWVSDYQIMDKTGHSAPFGCSVHTRDRTQSSYILRFIYSLQAVVRTTGPSNLWDHNTIDSSSSSNNKNLRNNNFKLPMPSLITGTKAPVFKCPCDRFSQNLGSSLTSEIIRL